MKPWLQIDGDPDGATINLVPQGRPGTATLGGLVVRALKSLPPIERPLSVPGIEAAPTSSMDVELDNADGALTRLWVDRPPMRRAARVLTEDGVLFSGIVTGLQMGATVRVNLEAGMDRPLSDTVPLRTSGQRPHEFVLASEASNRAHAEEMKRMPGMAHDEPGKLTLAPGAQGDIVWRFTQPDEVEMACLIAGHYDAGMKGSIVVTAGSAQRGAR